MIQIDRLRIMAHEALAQYQAETRAGGEPAFPQWAEDILIVCTYVESKLPEIEHLVQAKDLIPHG